MAEDDIAAITGINRVTAVGNIFMNGCIRMSNCTELH